VETPLRDEWDAIQKLDDEELLFCEAAARLGVDPFQIAPELSESLELAGDALSRELLRDFLDVVDPGSISESLSWVDEASADIDKLSNPTESDLTTLRAAIQDAAIQDAEPVVSRGPWDVGYAQAHALRSVLGISDVDRFEIERFVAERQRPSMRREIDGYGVASGGVRLVRSRPVAQVGMRFTSARALWHGIYDHADVPFLLTRARTTKQKIERAFAAELLAPAAGIEVLLQDAGPLWDSEDAEEVADHFGVRADVVERQIENNLVL